MTAMLDIQCQNQTEGISEILALQVIPTAGDSLGGADQPLQIELDLHHEIALQGFIDAATAAPDHNNLTLLSEVGLQGAHGTWTAWARPPGQKPDTLSIWIRNDLDSDAVILPAEQRGSFTKTQALSITLPLKALREPLNLELNTRHAVGYYRERSHSFRASHEQDLNLWLVPKEQAPPPQPKVLLYTPEEVPHAVILGSEVMLCWRVEGGISGKLTGPFIGGASVFSLRENSHPKLSEGKLLIRALTTQVYELEVLVDNGKDQVASRVIRRLIVDVRTQDKVSALRVLPRRVLPNGKLSINWVLWGVYDAMLDWGGGTLKLLQERRGPNGREIYESQGSKTISANQQRDHVTVELSGQYEGGNYAAKDSFSIVRWQKLGALDKDLKRPPSLAYAQHQHQGFVALCDGADLYWREVGIDDSFADDGAGLAHVCAARAVTTSANRFITIDDQRRLRANYPGVGDGISKAMPAAAAIFNNPACHVRVFVLGKRAYVCLSLKANALHPHPSSSAWSYPIDDIHDTPDPYSLSGAWTWEPVLASFGQHLLAACDGAFFAIDRESGTTLRIVGKGQYGTLDLPQPCASACDDKGNSLVKTGTPLVADRLLVIVGSRKKQDLVYSPISNSWTPCGRDLSDAHAAAFRSGASLRAWALHKNEIYTLPVGRLSLFDATYIAENASVALPDSNYRTSWGFALINNSGHELVVPRQKHVGKFMSGCNIHKGILITPTKNIAVGKHYAPEFKYNGNDFISGSMCWEVPDLELLLCLHMPKGPSSWDAKMEVYRVINQANPKLEHLPNLSWTSKGAAMPIAALPSLYSLVVRNYTRYTLVLTQHAKTHKVAAKKKTILTCQNSPAEAPIAVHFRDQKGKTHGSYQLQQAESGGPVRVKPIKVSDLTTQSQTPHSNDLVQSEIEKFNPQERAQLIAKAHNQQLVFGCLPEVHLACYVRSKDQSYTSGYVVTDTHLGLRSSNTDKVICTFESPYNVRLIGQPSFTNDEAKKQTFNVKSAEGLPDFSKPYFSAMQSTTGFQKHKDTLFSIKLEPQYTYQNHTYKGPSQKLDISAAMQSNNNSFENNLIALLQPSPVQRQTPIMKLDHKIATSNVHTNGWEVSLGWHTQHANAVIIDYLVKDAGFIYIGGETVPQHRALDRMMYYQIIRQSQRDIRKEKPILTIAGERWSRPRFTLRVTPIYLEKGTVKASIGTTQILNETS